MKTPTLYIIITLFLLSCGSVQESESASPTTQVQQCFNGRVIAISSEFGCNYLIQVEEINDIYHLFPVNLEEEYKVDDMKIRFSFHMTDEYGPCQMALPIVVDEIWKISP